MTEQQKNEYIGAVAPLYRISIARGDRLETDDEGNVVIVEKNGNKTTI